MILWPMTFMKILHMTLWPNSQMVIHQEVMGYGLEEIPKVIAAHC